MLVTHFDDIFDLWKNSTKQEFSPDVDVYENDANIYLAIDLPGVDIDKAHVAIENKALVISGSRDTEPKECRFSRIERAKGEFRRSFSVPDNVDAANVTADCKNGVLTVTLPKIVTARSRDVPIRLLG